MSIWQSYARESCLTASSFWPNIRDITADLRACLECLDFIGQAAGSDEARLSSELIQSIPEGTPLGDFRCSGRSVGVAWE